MQYRNYKDTSEKVSLLGFGCMRFPQENGLTKKIDASHAQTMIDYAMANGVNYYDTAYIYHLGKSEAFIGEALQKYPRESFSLATKLPTWLVRSKKDVEKYLDKQLEKCRVEYFDYYLVHCLNESNYKKMIKYNILEELEKQKAKGKIKKIGFSFHDKPPLLQKIAASYPWDFAQIQLNYIDWDLQDARQEYKILTDLGIPVIVMEPVRGGALATLNKKALAILQKADPSASAASWAIRYAASLPNILTVLSGMSTLEQAKDNIRTLSDFKPLSPAEYGVITEVVKAYQKSAIIPCTACRYCMDCPSNVDIPATFSLYNLYLTSGNFQQLQEEFERLGTDKMPKHCIRCNKCTKHCPQGIDIPDWMAKIDEVLKTNQDG